MALTGRASFVARVAAGTVAALAAAGGLTLAGAVEGDGGEPVGGESTTTTVEEATTTTTVDDGTTTSTVAEATTTTTVAETTTTTVSEPTTTTTVAPDEDEPEEAPDGEAPLDEGGSDAGEVAPYDPAVHDNFGEWVRTVPGGPDKGPQVSEAAHARNEARREARGKD